MKEQKKYDPAKIEKKWQKKWKISKIYKAEANSKKPKFYALDMFPYPSGEGLHVGHPKGYIATDIVSRMKRMQGFNVLHPMGFDAFGLPAEQYAIKMKINPAIAVAKNVAHYKKQLEIMGFDYDWSREINTTDPKFYKWTQWIFLKLFEKGLAYESFEPINWCPVDKTGLANEDVENGRCERCGAMVEKKMMKQWILKITDYADRLLSDLDAKDEKGNLILDWPESIKESQRNWIGKSNGAEINFDLLHTTSGPKSIKIFTTRPDTIHGATYVVLAPDHQSVKGLMASISNPDDVSNYIEEVSKKSEIERTDATKEKTGVELKGISVINPASKEEIPVWIADYVLSDYGTGAIMAVPAHDERDFQFAKKYNLQIKDIQPLVGSYEEITRSLNGKWVTKYKLKNWVFSRQRYWGEPIPILHGMNGEIMPVNEKDLPIKLPRVKYYEPTGTGESPLAFIPKWVNTKMGDEKFRRETNTMPQWAGSSWYYLRYADPGNNKKIIDPKKENYWLGKGNAAVDLYVGGAEHATRHLIYARFWHKFLYDIGVVSTIEPFKKLRSVGLIIAEDGKKMSKRWGNVINPDDVIKKLGADTMRIYEMFMGPFDQSIAWSTDNMIGSRRFIERVWKLNQKVKDIETPIPLEKKLHKTIHKVTEDISEFRFNTAISSLMIFANECEKEENISKSLYQSFLRLLAPFAPHVTEELWKLNGHTKSIHLYSWPKYQAQFLIEDLVPLVVQINGKTRTVIDIQKDLPEKEVAEIVQADKDAKKWLEKRVIQQVIYIPNRIINFLIDDTT